MMILNDATGLHHGAPTRPRWLRMVSWAVLPVLFTAGGIASLTLSSVSEAQVNLIAEVDTPCDGDGVKFTALTSGVNATTVTISEVAPTCAGQSLVVGIGVSNTDDDYYYKAALVIAGMTSYTYVLDDKFLSDFDATAGTITGSSMLAPLPVASLQSVSVNTAIMQPAPAPDPSPVPDPGPAPGPGPSSVPTTALESIRTDPQVPSDLDRTVPLGQAVIFTTNGIRRTVPATVADGNEVRIGTEEWSVRVSAALAQPDREVPVGMPFIAVAGNDITIRASGFVAGSTFRVVLQPSGTVIGSFNVGTNGEVSKSLTIPLASPSGSSTLQIAGVTPGPQVAGAAIGILVERSGSLGLWEGNQVMVGFPSKSSVLSARGQKKMQTYAANIQSRGTVKLVLVTAYQSADKKGPANARLMWTRATSVTNALKADGWVEVPMVTSVNGSVDQRPKRAGKVVVTVIYIR